MEVTRPCGECKWSRDGVPGWLLQLCYIVQRNTSLLPSDPRKVRRRSSDLWGNMEKAPAQKQWPDARRQGECPGSTICTCWWWKAHECLFDASAPWSKSSMLFRTTEFVLLNWGNLAFHERTSNGSWRACVTDPTRICRHGSTLPHVRASTHVRSLPLTTSICNFTDCPFPF